MRGELGVGWTENMKIELEQAVQHLLGKRWRDKAEKYISRLEEGEQKGGLLDPKGGRKKSRK